MPKNTYATFSLADANINAIGSAQKRIDNLKGDVDAAKDEANSLKLDQYCQLVAGIAAIKLTKGNLPTDVSSTVKGELEDLGNMKASIANKKLKNAVGARRVFKINGDNITPEMVASVFEDNDITSEAKLIKAVAGDDAKSAVDLLIEKVIGRPSTKKDDDGNRVTGDAWLDPKWSGNTDPDGKPEITDEDIECFKAKLDDAIAARAKFKANAEDVAAANAQVVSDDADANEMLDQL